jgi:hypothetical protein
VKKGLRDRRTAVRAGKEAVVSGLRAEKEDRLFVDRSRVASCGKVVGGEMVRELRALDWRDSVVREGSELRRDREDRVENALKPRPSVLRCGAVNGLLTDVKLLEARDSFVREGNCSIRRAIWNWSMEKPKS